MLESGERSSIVKYGYTMIDSVFRQGQVYIYKPDSFNYLAFRKFSLNLEKPQVV